MGIRIEHGPSMGLVGQLAFKTGQNEYVNRRRKELEAMAMQQKEMNQRAQMQRNEILANMGQTRMRHMSNMQQEFVRNQYQTDRDERLQRFQKLNNADLFNQQKDLANIRGQQQMDVINANHQWNDDRARRNHTILQQDNTLNRLFDSSNQAGRDEINNFFASMGKLQAKIDSGEIDAAQFQQQYDQGFTGLVDKLTGDNSSMYRVGGGKFLPGSTYYSNGGRIKHTVREDGTTLDELNMDPTSPGGAAEIADHFKNMPTINMGNGNVMTLVPDPTMPGGFRMQQTQTTQDMMDMIKILQGGEDKKPDWREQIKSKTETLNDLGEWFDAMNPRAEGKDESGLSTGKPGPRDQAAFNNWLRKTLPGMGPEGQSLLQDLGIAPNVSLLPPNPNQGLAPQGAQAPAAGGLRNQLGPAPAGNMPPMPQGVPQAPQAPVLPQAPQAPNPRDFQQPARPVQMPGLQPAPMPQAPLPAGPPAVQMPQVAPNPRDFQSVIRTAPIPGHPEQGWRDGGVIRPFLRNEDMPPGLRNKMLMLQQMGNPWVQ